MLRRLALALLLAALVLTASVNWAVAAPTAATVGKMLFFDSDLSNPRGQSCASCHDPGFGFADPLSSLPVSEGAIAGRFGNRNAPSAAYAALIPPRTYDVGLGTYVGGLFWDGRAETLEAQAKGPFLNPLEMHMQTKRAVVARVAQASYADDFKAVFGADSLSLGRADAAFDRITLAIAEYERSEELNSYSSKHDLAMTKVGPARMMTFTMAERMGMMLFNGKAQCSVCHVTPMTGMGSGGMMGMAFVVSTEPITFSDYRYANLGLPKNWDSPFLTMPRRLTPPSANVAYVDHGLAADLPGGVPANPQYDGMFRTPSLRNVALTAPYGHNGYFATLKEVVQFYNTRDVPGAGWPAPEISANLETATMGNLGLTAAEEDMIVAFLGTLSDGWWIRP